MKDHILIAFLFLCFLSQAQQDPQYSQYMLNPVIVNPAYIGSRDVLNATAMYRKQWTSISGAPQTCNLSLSGPLRWKSIGVGGHLVQESIGPKTWLSAYLDYSYRVKLAAGKLSLGLSTGLINYNFNVGKLNLQDASEPLQNYNLNNVNRFDMNAGIYYYTSSFYAGVSVTHITSPRLFDHVQTASGNGSLVYNLNPHVFVTLGKGFLISENLVFNPSVLIKITNARQLNADLNFNFLVKEKLWLGLSLRSSNALVGLVQYRITDKFRIGYSYDQGVRGVLSAAGGSHEIMIGYDIHRFKTHTVSTRYL